MADGERVADINARLKEQLLERMEGPGDYPTAIEGLTLLRRDDAGHCGKCFDRPLAAFIVQGRKRTFCGAHEYYYRECQYLVSGVDMPSSFTAALPAPDRPFLSLFFYLDRALLTELSLDMAVTASHDQGELPGAAVADADVELLDGVSRLVGLLDKPDQLSVRAPLLMRELHYLLLLGPYGGALRRLNTLGSQNNQVVQAIDWLRRNVAQPVRLDTLARRVNMSTSTLHRHFKSLTGLSPLQYIKQLRLHEARRLMLTQNERASSAALAVGYESVTQFNREYKRLFGEPPHRDVARSRESIMGMGG